jgi:predicted  nucleic acid-binding Zn-ribbon protein
VLWKKPNFGFMKNGLSLFAVLFLVAFATSCNVERSEKYQTLLAERDSLYTEAVAAKGGFDNALSTINEIENALESVRAAEGIIMMENQEGNTNQAVSEINAIQQTLRENRDKINALEKQLAEQGAKSKALNQTISRLKKQLEDKDVYIASLKEELQESRQQIADLSEQVSGLSENINDLNSSLDVMNAQNVAQQATIDNQDAKLNTVWICIAPQQTLVEKGILSKGGLFQPKEISKQGFDQTHFTQADKRDLEVIPLNTKKAKVMTTHPESSYQINGEFEGALELQIIDKEAFWSISNYLVVSIK